MRKLLVGSVGVFVLSSISAGTRADPSLAAVPAVKVVAVEKPTPDSSPNGLIQQGFAKHDSGDYAGAVALFKEAAATIPVARSFEARSLMELGQLDEAYSEATAAVQNSGCSPVTHFVLALVDERKGDIRDAMEQYQQVLEVAPNMPAAHNNLGGLYYRQEDFLRARAETEIALAAETNPHGRAIALANLAEFDELQGHLTDAEEKLNQALDMAPNDAPPYYSLAVLYDVMGRTDAARTMMKYALEIDVHGAVWRSTSYVWPELQIHVQALAADAQGDKAGATEAWSQLQTIDQAGKMHWTELHAAVQAHTAVAKVPVIQDRFVNF
jgi:tetratricopeptide (TPR) repeat protein